ncbi:hypothetical protein VTJ04DRAFT_459 [Mycothermus thermophilus]|uniref:uncharacterized protein n=1 Tax=Humicola insolens TaxID=85995 RepID=UPI0037435054
MGGNTMYVCHCPTRLKPSQANPSAETERDSQERVCEIQTEERKRKRDTKNDSHTKKKDPNPKRKSDSDTKFLLFPLSLNHTQCYVVV